MNKTLWLFLALALGLPPVWAQSAGQIIAAQYGAFKIQGSSTGGFSFPPSTCQVSGGGTNFNAFKRGDAGEDCGQQPGADRGGHAELGVYRCLQPEHDNPVQPHTTVLSHIGHRRTAGSDHREPDQSGPQHHPAERGLV